MHIRDIQSFKDATLANVSWRLHIFRSIFCFFLLLFGQVASGVELPPPKEMEKLILGTWKEEISSEGLTVKGESTYKPDFTVEVVGAVTGPHGITLIRMKLKWRIEGNVLITKVIEANHSELIGDIERDTILAMNSSQYVYRDSDGLETTATRVTKSNPLSAATGASNSSLQALVAAVGFAAKYQQSAIVLGKAYAKRGQGSDAQFSEHLSKIASSNLSPAEPCIFNVYKNQKFTEDEASQLTEFLTSPLGRKWADENVRARLASFETLSQASLDVKIFSADEQTQLATVYQTPGFIKYGQMTVSRDARIAMMACIYQAAGIVEADLH